MSNSSFTLKGITSTAIHTASNHNAEHAHLTPIYATSTFTFNSTEDGAARFAGEDKSKIYTRLGNPTFVAAEKTIAALESFGLKNKNNEPLKLKALLHSSGQAALATLFLSNLKTGDTILSHYALYGGTYEVMHKVLTDTGIKTIIADIRNTDVLEKTLKENSSIKLIHIETPSNPTINCIDIESITQIAKKYHIKVSVDNTFATPYLQQPFKYDVDFVIHSTTKFLNGHGTSIGGVLIGKDDEYMNTKVWKWHVLLGSNTSPFDAFLLGNGLKTLELRMDRHCSNAMKVATYLQNHSAVALVNYVGLPTHPDHAIAKKQMKQFGSLISFELKNGYTAATKFMNALKMCTQAISLGTTDTLISHPASTSHLGVSQEERLKFGITNGLIRLSVGIENSEDILNDFEQSLQKI
ncbi:MAG: aminotransferase class I/II-fold pyridoxal phosphate-dependent enzyme [Bacteroidetes bacterium]|nr:aminotransferase class I/II-fold pyridoxal phosphate-dependent enzyme [Bacteroidota bacterium]MBS1648531.1 aminotransferase class I/II-fold pyridoxal phosphate-dependent enzyme [Bacteroidota bacterium]